MFQRIQELLIHISPARPLTVPDIDPIYACVVTEELQMVTPQKFRPFASGWKLSAAPLVAVIYSA